MGTAKFESLHHHYSCEIIPSVDLLEVYNIVRISGVRKLSLPATCYWKS